MYVCMHVPKPPKYYSIEFLYTYKPEILFSVYLNFSHSILRLILPIFTKKQTQPQFLHATNAHSRQGHDKTISRSQ